MQIEASIQKKTYKHYLPKTLCRCASLAVRKVLACPNFFGVYNIFFQITTYRIGSLPFFPEMCRGISNRSGNQNVYFVVIKITLGNKTPKVSKIMGLFLEKLETFKTF